MKNLIKRPFTQWLLQHGYGNRPVETGPVGKIYRKRVFPSDSRDGAYRFLRHKHRVTGGSRGTGFRKKVLNG
jgi:hypothetical protein